MRPLERDSFDRYSRYRYVTALRRDRFGPHISMLDVGDPFGTIGQLFPDDDTVSIDLYEEAVDPPAGHRRVVGSALELPFDDDSFDLVTSHDTLEHIPDADRDRFLAELLRVAKGPVLVVAPFADPRVERCEREVNAYFVSKTGSSLVALDEHRECGLPATDVVERAAATAGVPLALYGDAWLDSWLAFWLVKGHLVSDAALLPHVYEVDAAVNTALGDRDHRTPHYRRVAVFGVEGDALDLPPAAVDDAATVAADLARLEDLATELTLSLPAREDPTAVDSALQGWIARQLADGGDHAEVARSLDTAFAASRDAAAHSVPDAAPAVVAPPTTSVAVILVNLNGKEHLATCLDSLAEQDYPPELVEVVLVDNASTDGSLELLAERYPWVRVLPQEENLGFAPAVNLAAAAVDTDAIALLNNDMRADPRWLAELVAAYAPEEGVVCVGGQILSWDGETLDFGEGTMNFYGMGQQVGFGKPVDAVDVRDGRDLLFACGGSLLAKRDVFVETGGYDPGFFAYFEDVDFGWRLQVLGLRTVLAADARTYHRHHGTSSRFPLFQRMTLYERNALRAMIKNYDDQHLQRLLGPALLLLAKRALVRGGLPRAPYDIGGDTAETEEVSRITLAHLHAVGDIVDDLPHLLHQRRDIQRSRRRSDEEIFARFGRPLQPVMIEEPYVEAQHHVVTGFRIDELFTTSRATRALVICNDPVAEKMSGPAIRAWEMARALATSVDVTVAIPEPTTRTATGVTTAVYGDEASLRELADVADIVVVQGYTLQRAPSLLSAPAILVADLYDPWLFENLELHRDQPGGNEALTADVAVINDLLDHSDFFICASERQRDYWVGMLAARGRLDAETYARDPSLRSLIDVVPFGLPEREPAAGAPVLKGVHPKVDRDDLVVLWGGGTWDWFDPVSVIEAFARVVEEVPNAKLYFLGTQLASPNVAKMRMADAAVRRAKDLGLLDQSIIIGDWVPYEEREGYLLEADVAVSAAADLAETRLAFRSRVLDYLWAGLPVVSTAGDVLSDLVRDEGVGIVVEPGDVDGLAHALTRMLRSPVLRAGCGERARAVARRFTWTHAVAPLRGVVMEPWRWRTMREVRPSGRRLTEDAQLLLAQRTEQLRVERAQMAEHLGHREQHIAQLEIEVERLRALERRLDVVRSSPVGALVRAAKRVRRAALR